MLRCFSRFDAIVRSQQRKDRMTLAELFTTLDAQGALPGAKDKKTALRTLATALGYLSLDTCPVDAITAQETTWAQALNAHWRLVEETWHLSEKTQDKTIGAKTREETRRNLRVVFREAAARGWLTAPLPPVPVTGAQGRVAFERQQWDTAPYRSTYHPQTGPRRYGLPQRAWPPDIQEGWAAYEATCKAQARNRASTRDIVVSKLVGYLGYIANICGDTPAWKDVFDVARLREFVAWHAERLEQERTAWGRALVIAVTAIARVLERPETAALAAYGRTLKPALPVHDKERHHWVSLGELEDVGSACLAEGRAPHTVRTNTRHPGGRRATMFEKGVILLLWVNLPLRSRNIREMELGTHLYKDHQGHWQLRFRGEELKVARRKHGLNKYERDLTDYCGAEFATILDEWVWDHRPKLPGVPPSVPGVLPTGPVFLTRKGIPYIASTLGRELQTVVAMHTGGKRFFPHMIRTIWATEVLDENPNYAMVATILGDHPKTVMDAYQHIREQRQVEIARATLDDIRRKR